MGANGLEEQIERMGGQQIAFGVTDKRITVNGFGERIERMKAAVCGRPCCPEPVEGSAVARAVSLGGRQSAVGRRRS